MVELKVSGALDVHGLRGYDAVPARVLGKPLLDVQHHTIDHDPAPAALVVLEHLAPRPYPPPALVLAESLRAVIRQGRQTQRVRSLGELLDDPNVVLGWYTAQSLGLEPDQDPVERGAVDVHIALSLSAVLFYTVRARVLDPGRRLPLTPLPGAHRGPIRTSLAYRPGQRDTRPEQAPVHRERFSVARVDGHQFPRGGLLGGGFSSPNCAVHQPQTPADGDARAAFVAPHIVHRVQQHAGVIHDTSPVAVVPQRHRGVRRVNRVAPRHPQPERRSAEELEIVPVARVR